MPLILPSHLNESVKYVALWFFGGFESHKQSQIKNTSRIAKQNIIQFIRY